MATVMVVVVQLCIEQYVWTNPPGHTDVDVTGSVPAHHITIGTVLILMVSLHFTVNIMCIILI